MTTAMLKRLLPVLIFFIVSCEKDTVNTDNPVQKTGKWEQLADYPGGPRFQCVSFVMDDIGYIGTGISNFSDWYAFDPATGDWTAVASLPAGKMEAAGFAINGKGYLLTGNTIGANGSKEVWEYDPVADTWTRKNDFPGMGRYGAAAFAVNGKGYAGTGFTDLSPGLQLQLKDWWEYDPVNDSWTQKDDYPGGPCNLAVATAVGTKGYMGISGPGLQPGNEWWEYDPATHDWTKKASLPGSPRYDAGIFAIGTKVYVGNGGLGTGYRPEDFLYDWWVYDIESDTWAEVQSQEKQRYGGAGFAIKGIGYFGLGSSDSEGILGDFWKFDPNGK